MTLPSAGVVHVAIGASPSSPWRGRSPLAHSRSTAALAARIEAAPDREARVPVGWIFPLEVAADQNTEVADNVRTGGINVINTMSPVHQGQQPSARWAPQPYGPEPDSQAVSLRGDLVNDVLSAYGISPALFSPTGDGAGVRESWRRFVLGTIGPVVGMLRDERRAKLRPVVDIHLDALRASDEEGRSRAFTRRAQGAAVLVEKLSMERAEVLRLAELGE